MKQLPLPTTRTPAPAAKPVPGRARVHPAEGARGADDARGALLPARVPRSHEELGVRREEEGLEAPAARAAVAGAEAAAAEAACDTGFRLGDAMARAAEHSPFVDLRGREAPQGRGPDHQPVFLQFGAPTFAAVRGALGIGAAAFAEAFEQV